MKQFSVNDKVLIYGFAKEGVSSLNFLRSVGLTQKIYIADDKKLEHLEDYAKNSFKSDKNLEFIEGISIHDNPNLNFNTVILTPGTPIKRLPKRLWPIITSQTAIFLEKYSSNTIGITGTKGKGTTSSLIYEILKKSGKDVVLVGNIGAPSLDFYNKLTENTLIVYELSSHQLTLVNNSPHVAVFLNIFPEHLDYYGNFEAYLAAKENITKFQTKDDVLVINGMEKRLQSIIDDTKAHVYPIVEESVERVSSWETKLLGNFNRFNIATAWEVAKVFNIDEETVKSAVKEFKPLEHRLEPLGSYKSIDFYNDSFATIPESTVLAMNTFGDRLETIITGGFDRGIKYTHLSKAIDDSQVKNLILFPTTGEKILEGIQRKETLNIFEVDNMEDAVKIAYQKTSPGKIVLLSCASPSFNLFKDFKDRGNQFKSWVSKLGN